MPTTISGSYPAVNSDSDAIINGLIVGKGGGAIAGNTAIGYQAGYSNTTGTPITVFGYQAGYANTTGIWLTAFGYQALRNSTGDNNSAFGRALVTNTTGTSNSAFGMNSLYYNTTGSYNTAQGQESLFNNTTASNNTAVGYQAGYSNSTGVQSTYLGSRAGYNATGNYNTIVGDYAGQGITSGTANSFLGQGSGNLVTTGSKNTIIGRYDGNQGGLDIRTSSNFIVLSDGDGNPRIWHDNGGTIYVPSAYAATTASAANAFIRSDGGFLRSTSALKYKQDIRDLPSIDINKFRPVIYKSKAEMDDQTKDHFGIIADEVDQAGITELVSYGVEGEVEGFQYERLTVVLLKTIQDLQKRIEILENK